MSVSQLEILEQMNSLLMEIEQAMASGQIDRLHPIAVQGQNARASLDEVMAKDGTYQLGAQRMLIKVDADKIREIRPDLDDNQVKILLNGDWSDISELAFDARDELVGRCAHAMFGPPGDTATSRPRRRP